MFGGSDEDLDQQRARDVGRFLRSIFTVSWRRALQTIGELTKRRAVGVVARGLFVEHRGLG